MGNELLLVQLIMMVMLVPRQDTSAFTTGMELHGKKPGGISRERQAMITSALLLPCRKMGTELPLLLHIMMARVIMLDTSAFTTGIKEHGIKSGRTSMELQTISWLAIPWPCRQMVTELLFVPKIAMIRVWDESAFTTGMDQYGVESGTISKGRHLITQ
jgi:hypothetical protein